jgi:hypothetical protein
VFKRKQRGKIGLALNGDWYEAKPAADLGEQRRNEKAAERALEFTLGWFARPVYQVCEFWRRKFAGLGRWSIVCLVRCGGDAGVCAGLVHMPRVPTGPNLGHAGFASTALFFYLSQFLVLAFIQPR